MSGISTLIVCNRFAGELHDIRDFVTPGQYEVQKLFESLQQDTAYDSVAACWQYLNKYVKYPLDKRGKYINNQQLISFNGALTYTNPSDYWFFPCEMIARARHAAKQGKQTLGQCVDVATTMVSLMRNQMDPDEIFVAVGAYTPPGKPFGGHAWVKILLNDEWYLADPTVQFGDPINFSYYKEYLLFNDVVVNETRDVGPIMQ